MSQEEKLYTKYTKMKDIALYRGFLKIVTI